MPFCDSKSAFQARLVLIRTKSAARSTTRIATVDGAGRPHSSPLEVPPRSASKVTAKRRATTSRPSGPATPVPGETGSSNRQTTPNGDPEIDGSRRAKQTEELDL